MEPWWWRQWPDDSLWFEPYQNWLLEVLYMLQQIADKFESMAIEFSMVISKLNVFSTELTTIKITKNLKNDLIDLGSFAEEVEYLGNRNFSRKK